MAGIPTVETVIRLGDQAQPYGAVKISSERRTLSILSMVLSLTGNVLVNYKKRMGFVIWTISNITWIVVNLLGETNWPQIFMFVVYAGLNTQGFVLWGGKKGQNP